MSVSQGNERWPWLCRSKQHSRDRQQSTADGGTSEMSTDCHHAAWTFSTRLHIPAINFLYRYGDAALFTYKPC
ncbi:hypothetical protein E2C01_061296 [Portunus trituberculatus]|uniref:Uncharacterized protein n=1 Tax=Portunus trituberculatus TaxID=210409 RepID=A0A5B7H4T4_PORTR|nr:hypothetical protein [Portunus trituberculatus]